MTTHDATAWTEPAPELNPFPGLRSFEPDEDHLFFGRETQIDELLARLRRTRFLAVVGTSGSGKSSLVRSGLIPSLHSGYMTQAGSSWRVAILRPGSDPIGNLAEALHQPDVLGRDPDHTDVNRHLMEATLHRSAQGLADVVRQAYIPETDNLLVVVDQFEELFRFKGNLQIEDSGDHAQAFVKLLLEASRAEDVPVYVVLTMRSDFIGNCTEFPGLAEAANKGQFLVPRMTREERRQAIVGPVAVGGAQIAPRLVTRLLNDVGDEPDQLPILQHALMRTWDDWTRHSTPGEPLDLRHYEAVGTLSEALSQHAEEAYRELSGERQRQIAEVMFKALTDRGSDTRGIRRPSTLAEISELAGASEDEVKEVVEVFRRPGRTFLMPPAGTPLQSGTVLDISHESLMRIWTRLIDWVDEEARAAQIYLRLSRAAARYQEGSAGLLRDPELQLALNWRDEAHPTAAWGERYDPAFERAMLYLDYSKTERDLYLERRERERRRQLRRARWLALILGSAAAATLAFGLYAAIQKIEAEANASEAARQRQEALRQQAQAEHHRREAETARQRAEDEQRAADRQRQIAEAERQRAIEEERRAQQQKRQAEIARVDAESARVDAEAQRTLALQQKARADELREQAETSEAESQRLARLQLARALAYHTQRMHQEGQQELAALLAAQAYRLNRENGGLDEDPVIFSALRSSLEILDPKSQVVIRGHGDAVRAVAVAADGRRAATGSDDGGVHLLDLAHPSEAPEVLATLPSPIRSLALSSDGDHLAVGALDGSLRVWNLAGRPTVRLLGGETAHPGGVYGLAFDPTGRRLASVGADGRALLWTPANDSQAVELLAGEPHGLRSVAFAPSGDRLAVGSQGGGVRLLALANGGGTAGDPETLASGRDVRAVAFGTEGHTLAAGTNSGLILVWTRAGGSGWGKPETLSGHESGVTDLVFTGGGLLASSSLDGTVRLWQVDHLNAEPIVMQAHSGWVWALAADRGGKRLVSGGADRTVRVFRTHAADYAAALCSRLTRTLTTTEWRELMPPELERKPACPAEGTGDPAGGNAPGRSNRAPRGLP